MLLFNDVFLLCKKKESAFKLMELIELHSITLDSSCGFLDASDGDILGDIPQLQFCVSAFSPFGFRREKRSMGSLLVASSCRSVAEMGWI